MLALGPLGEIADVLDCQRVQMQQLTEPAELIGLRVVQVEPEELMGLQVSGNLVKVVPLDHGERRAAGAHAAQTRTGSGGAGDQSRAVVRRRYQRGKHLSASSVGIVAST